MSNRLGILRRPRSVRLGPSSQGRTSLQIFRHLMPRALDSLNLALKSEEVSISEVQAWFVDLSAIPETLQSIKQ